MEDQQQDSMKQKIGKQFKAFREKLNLNMKQVEAKTGIPYSNICIIEKGKVNLTLDKIENLAAAYGMNVKIKFIKRR